MSTTPPIEDFDVHMPDDLDVEHCYRHPDRETGVRCANCGRPICHECMVPAAVGFRCPDCMAEQRRGGARPNVVTRQQTRNRWQGSAMMGGSRGLTVTKVLIAINVAVFLVELATGATSATVGGTAEMVRLGGLVPAYVIQQHEYWRMFSEHVPARELAPHRHQHAGAVVPRRVHRGGARPFQVPRALPGHRPGRLSVRCAVRRAAHPHGGRFRRDRGGVRRAHGLRVPQPSPRLRGAGHLRPARVLVLPESHPQSHFKRTVVAGAPRRLRERHRAHGRLHDVRPQEPGAGASAPATWPSPSSSSLVLVVLTFWRVQTATVAALIPWL